jgi:2-oxoglutarate ferredoxin oxidoreductase subunit beta
VTDLAVPVTTRKDWASDQEVRWCPGCGDYSILSAVQLLLPELGIRRENTVFVSGIGCAARFPYYMNTYGMHSIHGRAPAIATGLAVSRPDLDVWVVTGDGDSLSIGGNHLVHALRRNVNLTILMFNNQIYGLTKGQYSPTSEVGKITKSTPFGSLAALRRLSSQEPMTSTASTWSRRSAVRTTTVGPRLSRSTRTATSSTTARSRR